MIKNDIETVRAYYEDEQKRLREQYGELIARGDIWSEESQKDEFIKRIGTLEEYIEKNRIIKSVSDVYYILKIKEILEK